MGQLHKWWHGCDPLPLSMQTNQPITMVIAEGLEGNGDWRGLTSFLQPQRWGQLEFIRLALLSRALRGQDLAVAAKAEWELTLKAAAGRKEALSILVKFAAKWKWDSEAEDILWTIVNNYPTEKGVRQALSQILFAEGRTRSLMDLFNQAVKFDPSDLLNKNNLAMTALILNAQELKPYELAHDVYEKGQTNPSYASTYAFALHLQKKDPEARKVLEKLNAQELAQPSVAGYYGIVLEATGDRVKARKYLDLTSNAHVLPEERKLFDQARAGL